MTQFVSVVKPLSLSNGLNDDGKWTSTANRKEGNDQESIQLPYTFRPRQERERRTHLATAPQSNTISRKPKGQFLTKKMAKRIPKQTFHQDIQKSNDLIRDQTMMRTRQQEITEMRKWKKTNSWTPVGPTRARASSTNRFTSSLGRSHHRVWGSTHRRATKEGNKVSGALWYSGKASDSRSRGTGFDPH